MRSSVVISTVKLAHVRFYDAFVNCATASQLELSDLKRLADVFTFCSDNGVHTSWIDHFLCSRSIDDMILRIEI